MADSFRELVERSTPHAITNFAAYRNTSMRKGIFLYHTMGKRFVGVPTLLPNSP